MSRLLPLSALLWLGACATAPEVTAWRMAREVDTPAAYRDYLARYPASDRVDEARERLALAEQARVEKAATVGECVAALPKATAAQAAALADRAFQAAQAETSPDSLELFLEHFPGHRGAPAVRARLESLDLEQARRSPGPPALQAFLLRWPGSRHEPAVRAELAERAFAGLQGQASPWALKAFLAAHPDGPRATELRARVQPGAPRPGGPPAQVALDALVDRSPALQRRACALALSAAIRAAPAAPDALRRELRALEDDAAPPPARCEGARLKPRARAEGNLAEALDALEPVDALRRQQRALLEATEQREALARAAAAASAGLADELEAAELSEEVLGSGPLGAVDAGAQKGSQAARRAAERLGAVQAALRRDRDELRRLLAETEGLHRDLLAYVGGCVDAR